MEGAPLGSSELPVVGGFKRIVKFSGEDITLWTEGHIFWTPANTEQACSLNMCVIWTWGIWSLFLRHFNHFLLKQSLCPEVKSDVFARVTHSEWHHVLLCLLGRRHVDAVEATWRPEARSLVQLLWFHTCVSCRAPQLCAPVTAPFAYFHRENPYFLL